MKYYVPFKDIKTIYPTLKLHRLSKSIDKYDIENLGSTIYFEDAFKDRYNEKKLPSDMMFNTTGLVVNDLFYDFLIRSNIAINSEKACFIDKENIYHEGYWLVEPKNENSVISLDNSIYEESEFDEDFPNIKTYEFSKIILNTEKKIHDSFFWDPLIENIIIDDEILNLIKDHKLRGLSFLELEKYDIIKTINKNKDHIIIE
jgi:hypothetical protein